MLKIRADVCFKSDNKNSVEDLSETQVTTPTTPASHSTPYCNGVSQTYSWVVPRMRTWVVN